MRIAELEQENKRLALQVEVLSAAFANSSHKEKELMAEKAEMMEALRVIYSNRPKTLRHSDLQEFAMWFCQAWEEDVAILLKKADNKQNADE